MNFFNRHFKSLRTLFGEVLDLIAGRGLANSDNFSETTRMMVDRRSRPIATGLVLTAAVLALFALGHLYNRLWFSALTSFAAVGFMLHYARSVLRQERHAISDVVMSLMALTAITSGIHTVGTTAVMWFFPLILLFHVVTSRTASRVFNGGALILAMGAVYLETGEVALSLRVGATLALTIGATQMYAYIVEAQRSLVKEQAAELAKKNKALTQAINMREDVERIARHDLKTPLGSIVATPALLRAGRTMSEDEEKILDMMEDAAKRALAMVNLSLDMYRMEEGTYVFVPRAVDLAALTRVVVRDLTEHAQSKRVLIQVSGDQTPLYVAGEESLCYSIVANLMKNAIEAAPEDSVVDVYFHVLAGARLSIKNAGAVPLKLREKFFSKYATEGKIGGTGLGTYSAHLMAEVQEGRLTMETSEQLGTTLTLELNRVAAPAVIAGEPQAANASAGALVAAKSKLTKILPQQVLLVDDDEFNRKVLGMQLPQPPLTVETAINGRLALEAVMRQRPDVIFMDIEMPVMGGIEALMRIREFQSQAKQAPSLIVAFSSSDDPESQARHLGLGFDSCLSKPSSRQAVLALFATVSDDGVLTQAVDASLRVVVDDDLFEEIPGFLESRLLLLGDLRKALEGKNREATRKLAHKLAGSLGMFGFEWASQCCKEIENEAMTGELQVLRTKAEAVAQHLGTVEVRPVSDQPNEQQNAEDAENVESAVDFQI